MLVSSCEFTSLTVGSPVASLLPLASGQAFNGISSVIVGMVIPPKVLQILDF
jgi:hypothetical protein